MAEIHAKAQIHNLANGEIRAAKPSGEECVEHLRADHTIQSYVLSLDTAITEYRNTKEILKSG